LKNAKVKPLNLNQLTISIDRLTRFKYTTDKYFRVFSEILMNNLIFPKFKKHELEEMDSVQLRDWAEFVINYSLEKLGANFDCDLSINKKLCDYEKSLYKLDQSTENLLDNRINYKGFLKFINENSAINLRWLKMYANCEDVRKIRAEQSLRFPVEKVVIAEGATEEILLPEFAKTCGYDFDKNGIYVLPAGGKNQVVKLYYQLVERLKLPIFVLLDKDANENLEEIKPKLREIDKIHLLECGEFEDLLPLTLVEKTLNYELSNISVMEKEMFSENSPRVKVLEEIFKTRGMHEFKKVEFAQMIKNNIKSENDISAEIKEIINEIKIH